MRKAKEYKVGDFVRHSSTFLRNIQWVLDVPVNGRVESVSEFGPGRKYYKVLWSDGNETGILGCNLEYCPRARRERRA